MRKFSKILAVLLAVCVIFGVIAMTVSAEDTNLDASSLGTGITHGYGDPDPTIAAGKLVLAGTDYDAGNLKLEQAAVGGNSYVRLYSDNLPAAAFANNSTSLYTNGTMINFDTTFDYHVIDLDVGFDAYLVDGKLDYNATEGKQAYLATMNIAAFNGSAFSGYIYFVQDTNGEFYLSTNGAYSEDDYKLPTEKNVFTHLTYIANNANKTVYLFINGKLFHQFTMTLGVQRICINPRGAAPANFFSLAVDNFTSNYYGTGYSSGDNKYGVDDYMKTADFTKPLHRCEDVIYSANYIYEYAGDSQYSSIFNLKNAEPAKFLFHEEAVVALAKLTADELNFGTISISDNVLYTPVKGLKTLNFVAKNGAELTIPQSAAEDGYMVISTPNADGTVTFTVKMAESAKVAFVDGDGNVIFTKETPIGQPIRTLDIQVPVTFKEGTRNTYYILDKWVMKDGNGNDIEFYGNDEVMKSEYGFYATDIYTPGVNSIVIKATYKEVALEFAVLTKSSNALIISKEIAQEDYNDTANVAKVVNAAQEDVTLVLYNDATIAADTSLEVKANTTLTVDLNGNQLVDENGALFVVNNASTLNITSANADAGISAEVVVAATDSANSYNINIVSAKDKDIQVIAATLVDAKGGAYVPVADEAAVYDDITKSSATDGAPVIINIVGGLYGAADTMFNIATTEVKLSVADAYLVSMSNNAIFASAADAFADADITVTGTYLYAYGYSSATILGAFGKGMDISISDSKIIGDIFAEKIAGSVTIGANTYIELGTNAIKYTEVALVDDLALAANCAPVRANLYDEEADAYYGIVILDETDDDAMANIVTITWLDPAGDVYAVEEWFKGSLAVGYDTNDFGVLTDTKNGWYTLGYASWETLDGVDLKYTPDYTFDADTTFRPVKGLVASVAVKVNMSLLTKFEAHVYIPLATPENVEILGLFTHYDASFGVNYTYHVDNSALEYAYIDGMEYVKHSFYFDNSDVDKTVTRYLAIMVDGVLMVQNINVDLLGYAEAVMEQYGCGSEEAVLAYNLINYANEAYEFKTGAEYAPAADFLALLDHDLDFCTCYSGYDYDLDEVSLNYKEGLGDSVYGVSYDISDEMPALVIYANTDKAGSSLIKKVKVQFYGINGSVDETEYEYNLTLIRGENVVIDGVTYATFSFRSMAIYNAAEVMTITVTDLAGNEFSGDYSLATYIDHFICYPAENSGLDVAQALYSLAKVAKDYKNLAD